MLAGLLVHVWGVCFEVVCVLFVISCVFPINSVVDFITNIYTQ